MKIKFKCLIIIFIILFNVFALTNVSLAESSEVVITDSHKENNGSNHGSGGGGGGGTGEPGNGEIGEVDYNIEPVIYIKGDVNFDGNVDENDAMLILRYEAGLLDLNKDEFIMADLDNDGLVNGIDAMFILRYEAGFPLPSGIRADQQCNSLTITNIQACDGYIEDDELIYFESPQTDAVPKRVKLNYNNFKAYINSGKFENFDYLINLYMGLDFIYLDLIDINNDNKYDYASVKQYYSICVDEIFPQTFKITADGKSYNAPGNIFLEPDNEYNTYDICDTQGNSLQFSDIKKGDILNVFETRKSDDSIHRHIILTENKIYGTVSECAVNGSYKIGEIWYFAHYYIDIGDKGDFYIDIFNYIIKYKEDHSDKKFGIIYDSYVEQNGLDIIPKATIYTTEGNFETFEFARFVKKDNIVYEDSIIIDFLEKGSILMYITNSLNRIDEIYSSRYISERTNRDYNFEEYFERNSYRSYNNRIGNCYLNDLSILCYNKKQYGIDFNAEDISIFPKSLLSEDELYNFEAVIDKDKNIVFGVFYDYFPTVNKSSDVLFVTRVESTIDNNGNNALSVNGVINGETRNIKITQDAFIKDVNGNDIDYEIKKGDIIQFLGDDEIFEARIILSSEQIINFSNESYGINIDDEYNDNEGFIYGGKASDIFLSLIIFGNKEIECPKSVPTMLIRIGQDEIITITDGVYIDHAETDDFYFDDNDDYIIIYKFDGEALAAVIVDYDGDTLF